MANCDVLCVGDAATDVFIRLSDTHIHTSRDGEDSWLDLPFGGKVPFDYALDGRRRGQRRQRCGRVGPARCVVRVGCPCRRRPPRQPHAIGPATRGCRHAPRPARSRVGPPTATSSCGTARTGRSWCATSSTTTPGPIWVLQRCRPGSTSARWDVTHRSTTRRSSTGSTPSPQSASSSSRAPSRSSSAPRPWPPCTGAPTSWCATGRRRPRSAVATTPAWTTSSSSCTGSGPRRWSSPTDPAAPTPRTERCSLPGARLPRPVTAQGAHGRR